MLSTSGNVQRAQVGFSRALTPRLQIAVGTYKCDPWSRQLVPTLHLQQRQVMWRGCTCTVTGTARTSPSGHMERQQDSHTVSVSQLEEQLPHMQSADVAPVLSHLATAINNAINLDAEPAAGAAAGAGGAGGALSGTAAAAGSNSTSSAGGPSSSGSSSSRGPARLLNKLLLHTKPLLAGCQSTELVSILSSLVLLGHRPPAAWQASWLAAMSKQLDRLQAAELVDVAVGVASLKLTVYESWGADMFAVSKERMQDMSAEQLSSLVWAFSRTAPCMDYQWAAAWEEVTVPLLPRMGPEMLAVVIKALARLSYKPSTAWMGSFLEAFRICLFTAASAKVTFAAFEPPAAMQRELSTWSISIDGDQELQQADGELSAAQPPDAAPTASTISSGGGDPLGASASSPVDAAGAADSQQQEAVSVDALSTLLHALSHLRTRPDAEWMEDFTDAIRCKLSLLGGGDLNTLLSYLAANSHSPSAEWWEDYLVAMQAHFTALTSRDMVRLLTVLHAQAVRPPAAWLAAWCATTHERLCVFSAEQLHQVLHCMASCGYAPPAHWLSAFVSTTYAHLHQFTAEHLLYCLVLLDHMGSHNIPPELLKEALDRTHAGLKHCEPAVLTQLVWMLQASTAQPRDSWVEAFVAAAKRHLHRFSRQQLEGVLAGLHALTVAPGAAAGDTGGGQQQGWQQQRQARVLPCVQAFGALAREWLI